MLVNLLDVDLTRGYFLVSYTGICVGGLSHGKRFSSAYKCLKLAHYDEKIYFGVGNAVKISSYYHRVIPQNNELMFLWIHESILDLSSNDILSKIKKGYGKVMEKETGVWLWWIGDGEEYYDYSFDTKEEAILGGREYEDNGGFHICQAIQESVDLSEHICLDTILDSINENDSVFEYFGVDGGNDEVFFDVQKDDFKTLEKAIKCAIDNWQAERELQFVPRVFTGMKNYEYISFEMGIENE